MNPTPPDLVVLRPLDAELLTELLDTAVTDADPAEVMPPDGPVDGPAGSTPDSAPGGAPETAGAAGWTEARREAFLRFHRSHSLGPAPDQATYAVVVTEPGEAGRPAKRVAGAARLAPRPEPGAVEAGVWLGRSYRGRGVGTRVFARLLAAARERGATRLYAHTTAGNAAVRRLLTVAGADLERHGDGTVTAWVRLERRPVAGPG
ncbi:GNAT family N-acetyltransferase [Streptomyces carminius]|uniref:GNAT family N-acetyltransferase n=1 Tax=Streptomyces carminius TaxID=2665496 RepID=A0A2M8M016_9ACTN|nr:GNAT family N-acetyltransferase [Streptomyces carminius]PJE97530.1 GNAT family N-acetyltransferase [Streptomyces carminius]